MSVDLTEFGSRPKHWLLLFSLIGILGVLWIAVSASGVVATDRSAECIPAVKTAEQAVRAGMESWKNGEPVGVVPGTSPVVHVIDSHRKAGQKLESFEILGEVPGNAPRCFAVKTTLSGPTKHERLRYIVVGIDPLWVFRQEDYDLLSHWEHPMESAEEAEPDTRNEQK